MHPEVPAGDICRFVWEHLVNDVRNVSTSLERSEDDVLLLIHLVLSEIMSRSTLSKFTRLLLYSYYKAEHQYQFCLCFNHFIFIFKENLIITGSGQPKQEERNGKTSL